MSRTRILLLAFSVLWAVLLMACRIKVGDGKGDPNAPDAPGAKGEDPAEIALKAINGKVKRDDSKPGKPVVDVTVFKQNVTDADLKELAQFKELRRLELRGEGATGTGLSALEGIPLEEFVAWKSITADGLKEIAKFKTLRVLQLYGPKVTDADLPVLASLENLEELLISNNFDIKDVGTGKAITGMKKLRKLDVNNSTVGDGALMTAAKTNPELWVLHLYGTRVTDDGYGHVGKLKKLEDLKCSYGISDKGLQALAGLSELKKLSVWNSRVSYEALRKSPLLPHLTELEIGGALGSDTAARADDLRKAFPNLNVSNR